jgi:hypothetical protein
MYKPPYLQKYAGKATRFTCPACKTPHSFTLYLDGETHQPIHPTVGRCNREIKCGYHYTPRQYYADLRNQNLPLPNNHPQGTSHPDTPSPITHHHKAPQHDLHFPITHHHGDSQSNPNASSQPVSTHAPSKTASHSNFPQPQSQPQPTQTHKEQSTGSHPQHPYSALTEIVSQPQPQSKFQFQPQFQPQKPVPMGANHFAPHHKEQSADPDSNPLHPYPAPTEIIPQPQPQSQHQSQPQKPPDYIPHKYLKRSLSLNSNFVRFLRKYFTDVQIAEAANNYLLGATRNKEVIFWQVDIHGNIRTGKIMQYNPQTGRRLKTGYGGINWVHHKLKKSNPSYTHFNLSQCYFGEHLLRLYPDKPVAIVEAEKTAVIASMIIPNYNWLAAGNLNGLNVEKSRILSDKSVILYPDAGCYERWLRKAEQINKEIPLHLTVSNFPENFATPQQIRDGYDLADYIIEQQKKSK